jgi:hypothetical protein
MTEHPTEPSTPSRISNRKSQIANLNFLPLRAFVPSCLRASLRHPYTLAAALYLIFNGLRFMLIHDFPEWENVFVLAARHLRTGFNLYALVPEAQQHAYSYPPFMAFLALPFTFLSAGIGRFIWFGINAICAIILWRGAWRLSGGQPLEGPVKAPASEHIICILGLLCAIRFMQDNFEHRQTDLVIAVLILAGCYAWQNARDLLAATFFGLAAAMKGPPLLFAPYLIWRGRWLAALWLIILAISVNLLPDLISHPHPPLHGLWLTQWYDQMIKPLGQVGSWYSDIINNQSIAGAANRYFTTTFQFNSSDPSPARIAPLISPVLLKRCVYLVEFAAVSLSAVVMGRPGRMQKDSTKPPTPAMLECSIVILLMLLLSPMSSKPHFCILLLPAFCVAREAIANRNRVALFSAIACTVLVLFLDRNFLGRPIGNLAMWCGSVMWGTVALWVGCLSALRSSNKPENPHPL